MFTWTIELIFFVIFQRVIEELAGMADGAVLVPIGSFMQETMTAGFDLRLAGLVGCRQELS